MQKQTGFTLIELMIVIAILGILALTGLSMYGGGFNTIYVPRGWVATQCIDGYKVRVTYYNTEQLRDDNGRRIPCH